jgi:hypothetical protein
MVGSVPQFPIYLLSGAGVLNNTSNPNRAPIAVFVVLGLVVAVVLVILYLAVPISGDDYLCGGTQYYCGPFGGFAGLGGYGGIGKYPMWR